MTTGFVLHLFPVNSNCIATIRVDTMVYDNYNNRYIALMAATYAWF